MKKLKWSGRELTAYHEGHCAGAEKMIDAILSLAHSLKKESNIVDEPLVRANSRHRNGGPATNKQSVPCDHEWGIDGAHSNTYCKKCFINK